MRIFRHPRHIKILATSLIASMLLLFLPAPQPAAAVATGVFGATKQGQAAAEAAAAATAAGVLKGTAAGYAATAIAICEASLITSVPTAGGLESCIQNSLTTNSLFVMEGIQIAAIPYTVRGAVNTETVAQKQTIINILARIAIAALIRAFTNQVIGWIQNDGGSNVGFVDDLQGQLRREADIEGANFLNNLTGVNLCGDIGSALKITLRSPSSLQQRLGCTVTDIVSNVNDFYQDFSNGGWPAFLKIGLEPQNNPYGAYLIALDAKVAAEASARDGLLQRFLAGSGFQGTLDKVKVCVPIQPSGPGGTIGEECHYDTKIKLPGSAVASILPSTIMSDLNYLYAAREIDDAIIAVANALIGKVISSAVSISRGDEGERDAGPGIFDEELAEGSLDVEELAGNSVEEKNENAILSTDTALTTATQSVSASQRNLFLALRQSPPPNTIRLEAELKDALSQRDELLTLQTELMEIKRVFIAATAPQDIINAGTQFTAAQSRFNQVIGKIPNLPATPPATGVTKTDTETELRNTTLHIGDTTSLLREMQGEVRRLANQEASTTPQRKIELDAKSKDIDAEVIRLGESRSAIASSTAALVRATTPTEITAAIDNAITEMTASLREIQRANTLMVSIVPLLKPE